jgi:CheY-like chemotaxis protein
VGEGEHTLVLLVDDEHAIVEALGEILAWEGFTVRSAANGRDALALAGAERPDVILLDVMMPVMDGVETVQALHADASLRDVPVVLMSAAPIPRIDHVPLAGTLQKPFDVRELTRALAAALARSRGRGGGGS